MFVPLPETVSVFAVVIFFTVISVLVDEAAVGSVIVTLPDTVLTNTIQSDVVSVVFADSVRFETCSPVNAPVLGVVAPMAAPLIPVGVKVATTAIAPELAT